MAIKSVLAHASCVFGIAGFGESVKMTWLHLFYISCGRAAMAAVMQIALLASVVYRTVLARTCTWFPVDART